MALFFSYVRLEGRGTALVEFEDPSAAERCVTHNRVRVWF